MVFLKFNENKPDERNVMFFSKHVTIPTHFMINNINNTSIVERLGMTIDNKKPKRLENSQLIRKT